MGCRGSAWGEGLRIGARLSRGIVGSHISGDCRVW